MGSAPLARRALIAASLAVAMPARALEAEVSGGLGSVVVSPQHELVEFPNATSPIGATFGAALRGTVYPVRLPWRLEAGLSWEGDLQTGAALVGGHRGFASLGLPIPRMERAPVVYLGAGFGVLGARSDALGRDMDWSGSWGAGVAVPVVGEHGRVRLDLRNHLGAAAGFDGGASGHVGAHLGFGWVFGRAKWTAARNQVLDLVSGYEDSPTEEEFARLGDLGQDVLLALAKEGTLPPSRASRVVTSMAFFPDETTQRFLEKKALSPSTDPWMQRKAVWALVSGYGDDAIPVVRQVLDTTEDVQVKVAVSKALDQLDTPAAYEVIQELPGVEIDAVDDGGPLDDVRLVVTHPDGRKTSHLGRVRFVDASLALGGAWSVEARRGRCERGEASAETLETLTSLHVPLGPLRPAKLQLAVTTPEGDPVPGARVTVRTDEPSCAPTDIPPLEGATGAIQLGEGTFEVFIEHDGYGTTRHEVTLAGEVDEEVLLSVELQPTKLTIEKGKITTREIYFDSGQATLQGESLPALEEIASSLQLLQIGGILIEGHTDNRGQSEKNLQLSKERADAVRAKLIELGVDGSLLQAEGFGDARPVADNRTVSGRAKNRRVDFVLLDAPAETEGVE